APARHPERLAVLRTRGDRDLDRPVERGYLDSVAERRLNHVDPKFVDDFLITPGEVRVRLDSQHDIQVARWPSPDSRFALATEANLRPGVDPGRNSHRQSPSRLDSALSPALHTRVLQQPPSAATGRTGGGGDDRTEDGLCSAPDLTRSPAPRTGLLAAARLRTIPRAALTGHEAGHVDLFLDSQEG